MNSEVNELSNIYQSAVALPSLRPGEGYDDIGRAMCEFVLRPRTLDESNDIISKAVNQVPNFLSRIQDISMTSELLHEEAHSEKFLKGTYTNFEELEEAYGYDWPMGKAKAELSIAPLKPDSLIWYFCRGTVPFTAIAMKKLLPDLKVSWIDNDPSRLQTMRGFLDTLRDFGDIQIESLERADFEGKKPDIAYLVSSHFQAADIYNHLHKIGCEYICLNGAEGMCQIMYPGFPDFNSIKGYEFVRGLTPHHMTGPLQEGFKHSDDLSFLSLALFKRKAG